MTDDNQTAEVTGKAVRVRYLPCTANKSARYRVTISDGKSMGRTYSRHDPKWEHLGRDYEIAAAVALHYVNNVLQWNVSLTGGTYANDWYFTTHQGVTP